MAVGSIDDKCSKRFSIRRKSFAFLRNGVGRGVVRTTSQHYTIDSTARGDGGHAEFVRAG